MFMNNYYTKHACRGCVLDRSFTSSLMEELLEQPSPHDDQIMKDIGKKYAFYGKVSCNLSNILALVQLTCTYPTYLATCPTYL